MLPPARSDASGLADPYAVVRLAGKTLKFPIKKETLNPQWSVISK